MSCYTKQGLQNLLHSYFSTSVHKMLSLFFLIILIIKDLRLCFKVLIREFPQENMNSLKKNYTRVVFFFEKRRWFIAIVFKKMNQLPQYEATVDELATECLFVASVASGHLLNRRILFSLEMKTLATLPNPPICKTCWRSTFGKRFPRNLTSF